VRACLIFAPPEKIAVVSIKPSSAFLIPPDLSVPPVRQWPLEKISEILFLARLMRAAMLSLSRERPTETDERQAIVNPDVRGTPPPFDRMSIAAKRGNWA
jgi:hypothetical protein